MVNINDIAITSLETITAFDNNGDYLFTLDELQSASINQTQDKSEITGKQGRRLATLKRNKAVTVSGTNGIVSHGLLEMQTGSDFSTETAAEVMWSETLTVGENNQAKTSYKATGTSGSEIVSCYQYDSTKGTLSTKYTQHADTVSVNKFTYDPDTKVIKFDTTVNKGTEFVVYYKRQISASVLKNESGKLSKQCKLYIDALGEDTCGNTYHVQFRIPKADFSGEFSFEMGDNQTVHSFEADALSSGCTGTKEFFTYIVFGANDNDAAAAS